MNDWTLLNAYVTRDSQEAFTELVTRYMPLVYASAVRRAGPELAEDISQGVFMILAQKSETLNRKHRGTLAGWLFRATRFASSEAVRQRRRRIEREQLVDKEGTQPTGPIEEVTWREIRPLLDHALDILRPRDRDAVIMRYIQGASFADVGTALGVSENTATKRVERAIDKLRAFFERKQIIVSIPLLASLLSSRAASAGVAALAQTCAAAALASKTATATISAAAICTAAVKSMAIAQAKSIAAVSCAVLSAGVVVTGTTTLALNTARDRQVPFEVKAIQPLSLCYEGHVILPDGSRAYQVNSRNGDHTHIVREGESFEGYTISQHVPIHSQQAIPGIGGTGSVDISELTVTNADTELILVRGKPHPTQVAIALVYCKESSSNMTVRAGDTISTKKEQFLATRIDGTTQQLIIRRLRDGREFTQEIENHNNQKGGHTP
ncbi:MAG: sigma-70 family RNA polymerase sigma factor [Kiritimatiellae bacterium]|nr:sigma-70 family RNA polymerase sigma factor [Kiritimatiellia bacterium]